MSVFCVIVSRLSFVLRMVFHATLVCLRASCVQLLADIVLLALYAIKLDLLAESVDNTDVNKL